jgi:hypothetical protein
VLLLLLLTGLAQEMPEDLQRSRQASSGEPHRTAMMCESITTAADSTVSRCTACTSCHLCALAFRGIPWTIQTPTQL